ncbi:MarR family transcriptional regulator [Clostridioides difficile]
MNKYDNKPVSTYLSYFHRIGSSFLSKSYEKYGIGSGQYQFLIQLYLNDGISHDILTEKVAVDKATTTRAIKKLQDAGYVKVEINEKDKRKYHIFLTDKAKELKNEIFEVYYLWDELLVKSLSEDEINNLLSTFKKMYENGLDRFLIK